MLAIGDCALLEDRNVDELRLVGARGVLAKWPRARVSFVALADPPRLAILHRGPGTRVADLIDVATGDAQVRFYAGNTDKLLGFDPTGSVVVGSFGGGLECYGAGGGLLSAATLPGRAESIVFDADGGRALVWSPRDRFIARVALRHGGCDVGSATAECEHVAVDADLTRAIVVERHRVVLRKLDDAGYPLSKALSQHSIETGAKARRLWATNHLDRFGVLSRNNVVSTFRITADDRIFCETRTGFTGAINVDFASGRVLALEHGKLRLLTVTGAWLGEVFSTRACFAAAGGVAVAVAKTHGATAGSLVRILPNGFAGVVVEGPTDVVDVAPHPRGVLALDASGSAYVVDVAADTVAADTAAADIAADIAADSAAAAAAVVAGAIRAALA